MRHNKFLLIAASAAALTAGNSAMAAGFAVSAQSAYGMGNAYAGNAAVASDASTVLTNPAGMFELENPVFGFSAAVTSTGVDYVDRGSRINPLFGSDPLSAGNGVTTETTGGNPVTPGVYYARQLNQKWAIGLGINVPFATSSQYDDDWVGRYHAVETEVTAIDINPTVAYRINDKVSIGGGISVQRANALLTNKIDSGTTCQLVAFRGGIPNPAQFCSAVPVGGGQTFNLAENTQALDSNVEIDGSGTAITFNIGALFKPKEGTKIGVAYRHGTQHELDGDADFTLNPVLQGILAGGTPPSAFLSDSASTVSADLPATLDFSVAQMVNDKVELLGTLKWTQWSSFDELTSEFANPEQDTSSLPFAWEDTVTASAGFNFALNNKVTLRAGFSYDQSPIPNPRARSPRGAANDRYWYSAGGTYQINKRFSASAAFTRVEIDQSAIDNTPPTAGSPTLRGEFDFDVNLFAFQLNWHFI